jgi:drug/metabolite transporter (DMT)-like permease
VTVEPPDDCIPNSPGVESPFVTGTEDRTATLTEASLLLAVLFLGTNPVAVKVAVAEFPPLPFVAVRFTVAGLLLLGLVALLESGGRPGGRELISMAGVGLIGVGANNVAFTLGVGMTTASITALLYAAVPVWGILLGLALGLERPTLGGLSGVCLAFLGVGVVVYGGLGGGGTSLVGDLLVVVATMCWSSYAVLSLPLLGRHTLLVVAAYTMLFGGLGAVPLALPGLVGGGWVGTSGGAWWALAYSTLFVAAFGFWTWQRGVSRVGANRVLVYQYLITLVGVLAGVVLLGEGLTANMVLGGAVVLLGVYVARRQ